MQTADFTNQPLFPEWKTPTEWPWVIDLMVSESRRILSYFEHLPKDQQPPAAIWHSVYKCNNWIENHKPGQKAQSGFIEMDEADIQR